MFKAVIIFIVLLVVASTAAKLRPTSYAEMDAFASKQAKIKSRKSRGLLEAGTSTTQRMKSKAALNTGSVMESQWPDDDDSCTGDAEYVYGYILGVCEPTSVDTSQQYVNCDSNATHYYYEVKQYSTNDCTGPSTTTPYSGTTECTSQNKFSCTSETTAKAAAPGYDNYGTTYAGEECTGTIFKWSADSVDCLYEDCGGGTYCYDSNVLCSSENQVCGSSFSVAINVGMSVLLLVATSLFI